MSLTIEDIVHVFEAKGHEQYDGEPVTQLGHALQSAALGNAYRGRPGSGQNPMAGSAWLDGRT